MGRGVDDDKIGSGLPEGLDRPRQPRRVHGLDQGRCCRAEAVPSAGGPLGIQVGHHGHAAGLLVGGGQGEGERSLSRPAFLGDHRDNDHV